MKTITQTYTINASAQKVWEALIDPKVIDDWGGGPAKVSEAEGEAFSLWGGEIHGTNLKVIPKKLLKQEWISKDNDTPGVVTFTLKESNGGTTVVLVHSGVSDASYDDLANGWKDYYMGPLKELLES